MPLRLEFTNAAQVVVCVKIKSIFSLLPAHRNYLSPSSYGVGGFTPSSLNQALTMQMSRSGYHVVSAKNIVVKKAASREDNNSANLFNTSRNQLGKWHAASQPLLPALRSGKGNRSSRICNSGFHLVPASMKVSHTNP